MKLDVMVQSLAGGGAERVAANLAAGLAKSGHDVRLTSFAPLDEMVYRPTEAVEVVSIGGRLAGRRFRLLSKLLEIVVRLLVLRSHFRQRDPEVILAVQGNMALEVGLACSFMRTKVIGCEHNGPEVSVRGRLWRALRPLIYPHLEVVTVLSEGAAVELRRMCPRTRVEVVPNASPWPLQSNPPHVEPDTVLASNRLVILAAGRLHAVKAFDELIETFALIADDWSDIDLVIAGEGSLRSSLEDLVRAKGLGGRVHIPGRIGNMADWYRRATLFAMSSRWEGQPMVMLEAMSHELPVVTYDFNYGPREIISPGVDGLIVPYGDRIALAAAIVALLRNDVLRRRLAKAAASVRVRFGEDAILRRWNGLLADVTKGPRHPPPKRLALSLLPPVDSNTRDALVRADGDGLSLTERRR